MNTKTTSPAPVEGPAYDPARPETRQAWLEFRAGGITATQVRDWGSPAKRRKIIEEKVTGEFEDLSHISYVKHGVIREPVIAQWIEQKFGIKPCDSAYASAENSRWLASPDGISVDPWAEMLIVGPLAAISEIKTSKHDLHPGKLDDERTLLKIEPDSHFAMTNYYTQMQWQLMVMQAETCLFVWEQHDNIIDPTTGTFTPLGVPQYCWINRDKELIGVLKKIANKALDEIDTARATVAVTGMPPVSADISSDEMILIADLLKARQAEAIAKAAREKAWKELQEHYLREGSEDIDKADAGDAWLTVSTSTTIRNVTDMDAARKRAPKLCEQYDALIARYTKPVPTTSRRLAISEKRA